MVGNPSSNLLSTLIAEATVLAGGEHPCAVLGHRWKSIGGRQCPRAIEGEHEPPCSQTVYECESCGDTDYGETGGPAYRDCFELGPCDSRCVPA
jgi:hypothetical protein